MKKCKFDAFDWAMAIAMIGAAVSATILMIAGAIKEF